MKKNLKNPKNIDKFQFNNAILVEGKDDLEFIVSFLKKLKIDDKIYVHEVGGNKGILGIDERSLRTCIKDSNFKKNVRNLAIIFDGDGKKNKFKEIVRELEQLNQENEDINFIIPKVENEVNKKPPLLSKPISIATSVYLFEQDLESLILKTFDNNKYSQILKTCVPKFFECCNLEDVKNKNTFQALLAMQISKKSFKGVKDIATLSQREASTNFKNDFINYDHKEFDNIKEFLVNLLKLKK
jgi:hypothetical protein